MIDCEVDIETEDGTMNTFVAYPHGKSSFPAVFMYMPASSIRDESSIWQAYTTALSAKSMSI